jgi:hypothetical protein
MSVSSSGRTWARRPLRQAASAVKVASSSSFLRPWPTESTLTRAESFAGTSTTSSPAERSRCERGLPRPLAPSMAHRRSGKRFAHRSNACKPRRFAENSVRSSSSLCSSNTATALVALCGSTPINTFTLIDLLPRRHLPSTPRGGHTDFGMKLEGFGRTSVEPLRHGGHRTSAGLIRANPQSRRQVTTPSVPPDALETRWLQTARSLGAIKQVGHSLRPWAVTERRLRSTDRSLERHHGARG